MVVPSHASRFAVMQDRVAPWRTPQRKKVMTMPYGVCVLMVTFSSDSAIHSMYPWEGKLRMLKGSSWSSVVILSKYFSLSSSICARMRCLCCRVSSIARMWLRVSSTGDLPGRYAAMVEGRKLRSSMVLESCLLTMLLR